MSGQKISTSNYINSVTTFESVPLYEFFINVSDNYHTYYKISESKAVHVDSRTIADIGVSNPSILIVEININIIKI